MFGATPRLRLISEKRRRPNRIVAHDEQRPALADDGERVGDRAVLLAERPVGHGSSLARLVAFCYRLLLRCPSLVAKRYCSEHRMERRWKVLALVSVGVFMVSLDLFIVNIAFPEDRGRLRRLERLHHLLGAERLRDRDRRADGLGAAGWPTGTGASGCSCGGSASSCSARRCAAPLRRSRRWSARA